jgi:hypothetical protein
LLPFSIDPRIHHVASATDHRVIVNVDHLPDGKPHGQAVARSNWESVLAL